MGFLSIFALVAKMGRGRVFKVKKVIPMLRHGGNIPRAQMVQMVYQIIAPPLQVT